MSEGVPGLGSYGFGLSDFQKSEGIKEQYCDNNIVE